MSSGRYHHVGATWRGGHRALAEAGYAPLSDYVECARFGFCFVPDSVDPLPRRAVFLPLLGAAAGALLLTGFWIGVACFDWLACVTVSQ